MMATPFVIMLLLLYPLIGSCLELQLKPATRHQDQQKNQIYNSTPYFPLEGTLHWGCYTTKVNLGNPAQEFTMMIDPGVSDTWMSCISNSGCPSSTVAGFGQPALLDPARSTTASFLPCTDLSCSYCYESDKCGYATTYVDDSAASGYYVRDNLSYNVVLKGTATAVNSSTPYIVGCSTSCTGDFTSLGVDGILAFGRGPRSFVSQISAAGLAPPIFSHCLKGEGSGGTLIFGDVEEPPLDYSPLVASESEYIMNLQSVSANGQELKISPEHQGAIVDIGTTYGSLVEEVFYFLVNVINAAVSGAATATTFNGRACYYVVSVNSTINKFPEVSLTFAGGALKMVFKPDEYLRIAGNNGDFEIWCIIFHPSSKTVLGDFFLREKIVAYDLLQNRIGLRSYNCSLPYRVGQIQLPGQARPRPSTSASPEPEITRALLFSILMLFFIRLL